MAFRLNGEDVESGGVEDRLLLWDRVQDMAGISRTTAWRMQRSGAFPTPVLISPGRVGWWESELTAWKASRSDARPLKSPMRPRLPGIPRRVLVRTSSGSSTASAQEEHSSKPVKPAQSPKTRRRGKTADSGQIDFGF